MTTRLDLRLAVGAAAAWAALAVLGGAGVLTLSIVAGGCALVGILATLLTIRGRAVAAAVALAGWCTVLVLVPYVARLAHARASPLLTLAARGATVTATFELTGDPHALAARGPGGARVVVAAEVSRVRWNGAPVASAGQIIVLAPAGRWRDLLPGTVVRADGRLQPPLDPASTVPALSTNAAPVLERGPPWWQRAAGTVRTDLREAARVVPQPARGLLPGLVDGDTADLDPVLAERFRLAGLTHLVAVSGTNCSILVGAVLLLLRRLGTRPLWCAAAGALVLVAFVVVARPSPSVLRAAAMALVTLGGLASGRPRAAIPALAAAVLALLVWDPDLATDPGFAMSVLATAAILLIAPRWSAALRGHHVPTGIAEAVAVAAAAHLVTAPIVAAIAGRVSVTAIAANVLAEPVVAVTTIVGFAAAVTAPLCLPLGTAFAWVAGWPVRWLVHVGEFFGGLDGAVLPWPAGTGGAVLLAVVVVGLWLVARRRVVRTGLAAAALVAVIIQLPVRSAASGWPPPDWRLVACDVGQGDALVLRAGPHAAVVVDTGPDPVAVDRCLGDLDVTAVPLLVITHLHQDHVGGIAGVLHGRSVARVITGPLAEPATGLDLLRHDLPPRQLSATVPVAGTRITVGAVVLDVLGPPHAFRGTRSDPNNSSLVLRATVGGLRILLPGDAEIAAQQELLDDGMDLRADVLKVPHHGSAYSAPAFLGAVHASVAVISVGAGNDYGHPSPMLLAALRRLDIPVWRTDQVGDIAVCGTPGRLRVLLHGLASTAPG